MTSEHRSAYAPVIRLGPLAGLQPGGDAWSGTGHGLQPGDMSRLMTQRREKRYVGRIGAGVRYVGVIEADDKPRDLALRREIIDHSLEFNWGYQGSGPAQLALAILMDALGPSQRRRAVALHQEFKRAFVARWDGVHGWDISAREVIAWADGGPKQDERT